MTARARLLALLRSDAYRRGTFTLASGRTSDFFIDCKQVLLSAEGHALAGELFCEAVDAFVREHGSSVRAVAGVALGGCPLASAVSMRSFLREGASYDALYVRKEAKDHGTKKLIEGRVPQGAPVVLLEDVLTSGGSSLAAVGHLVEAGYDVRAVFSLVDRREGGLDAVRARVPHAQALFAREDFVS